LHVDSTVHPWQGVAAVLLATRHVFWVSVKREAGKWRGDGVRQHGERFQAAAF